MPTRLYLDSARMGLLSERARLAHLDYVRLAATEGCSLYFSRLLENGYQDWPAKIQAEYTALEDWQGVPELEAGLRHLCAAPATTELLLSHRTAQLMKLAVHELCRRCRRVLVSDLTWPSYRMIFEAERGRRRTGVSTVAVRSRLGPEKMAAEDVVEQFARDYDNMGCDGLYIPVVSHDGIRLPVDRICTRLNDVRPLQFVVLDGAQAIGHVPDELGLAHCDVFVAGTHKWLQGHVPMGVALLPRSDSAHGIQRALQRLSQDGPIDDPLLAFTQQLKAQSLQRFSETVSLASLFTCRAAIADGVTSPKAVSQKLRVRIANADRVRALAHACRWAVLPRLLPNGIVMLRSSCPVVRGADPGWVREFFAGLSVSLSSYESGVVRLAMSSDPLTSGQWDLLRWALRSCDAPVSELALHDVSSASLCS